MIQGKTNSEIATILSLSALTIRTHLERIYQKREVKVRTTAAIQALERLGFLSAVPS